MRVLFIGGTGTISAACVRAAIAAGHDVSVLNRGSGRRPLPTEVREIVADVRDEAATRTALDGTSFDVVADFLSFTPDHVATALRLVEGRTGQYVFISSASAYQTPPGRMPVRESTPLRNPFWQYSRDKIACEDLLVGAYRESGFPVTIVRPSHTYDRTTIPVTGGWTVVDRMRRGLEVVVPGDGTSLWTLTHHADFARAFVGLLGLPAAVGDVVHITSDEALPWDQIYTSLAAAAGVDDPALVHVASESVAAVEPEWGPGLLGDKAHSVVFDNAKVKAFVPGWQATTSWATGAREIVEWYDADASRREVDPATEAAFERLLTGARAFGA